MAADQQTRKLEELEERLRKLELQSDVQPRAAGTIELNISTFSLQPNSFRDGASVGVRYIAFRMDETDDGYSQLHDDLAAQRELEATYSEDGEMVLRGKTIEVWQESNSWWAKVAIDAFC